MTAPPSPPPAGAPGPVIVIEPKKGWVAVDWRELWEFRELLGVMTSRDLKSRYKQTIMGAAWAVLAPLMNMVIMTVVFGKIAKVSTGNVPSPLFFMAATVPWALFTGALNGAANSLVANSSLFKKIYFPRLYIPTAAASVAVVDFAIAAVVMLVMNLAYGYVPKTATLLLPVYVLLALMTALGAGLWLGALMVLFRDVRTLIPFGVQAWMYATPVPYLRTSMIHNPNWQWLLDLNPMTPVVEAFRWSLLGADTPPNPNLWMSVLVAVLLFVTGLYFFRRIEKTFADVA